MSPRRPRRRARRRSAVGPVLVAIVVAVAIVAVLGGISQVPRQSGRYDADANRSLAAQGEVVVERSNQTAGEVRTLMSGFSSQIRQTLEADLDSVAEQTRSEAADATLASGSAASGTAPANFAVVFRERAQAVDSLQAAVDGFLGMSPVPPPGTTGGETAAGSAAPTLSATQATSRIAAAGTLLSRSDQLYRSVRSTLAGAAGHAQLPASQWVTDPAQWQLGAVTADIDLMASSPDLTASHYVVLRTVRLSPSAVPSPPGAPDGASVISPTTQLGVTVVMTNDGSVDEDHATAKFTLVQQPTGASRTQTRSGAVPVAGSVTLPTVVFSVKPGTSYLLTVAVLPEPGQVATANTVTQQALQIAPAS